jgi:hypothetical protein
MVEAASVESAHCPVMTPTLAGADGRKRRTIFRHRAGPPHSKTLGDSDDQRKGGASHKEEDKSFVVNPIKKERRSS